MMLRLESKVVLVTGGASGLGKAIAQRLASDGAQVVITDVNRVLGAENAARGGFRFIPHDVSDEAAWDEVIRQIEAEFGTLDILVNNAGVTGQMSLGNPLNASLYDWRKVFAVNVEGVFLGCKAAIKIMSKKRRGSIINVSSIAAFRATPRTTAYGASKAAVRQLTQSVAQYCAQEKLNIRCNSVHPGYVRTGQWDDAVQEMGSNGVSMETIAAQAEATIPMGDLTLPEDIAAAVAFLASDDARHITGEKLIVDGGVVGCNTFVSSSKADAASRQTLAANSATR